MCGIVGALSFGEAEDTKAERLRQEAMIFLTTELLQLTQSRGKDATGVAALFSDGNFVGLKMGIPSPDFIARFGEKDTDYDGFLKVWRDNLKKRKKSVKTFIGHCRKTSVGQADDNNNNHPIKVGDIIGIHNGTLTNFEKIFKKLKCPRDGEVDSEAIIRLVHHMSNDGKDPFTMAMLKEVCLRLHGTYSCIVLNGNSPDQAVSFRDSKPAEAAILRPLGIMLIASDKDFLKNVLFKYNKMAKLYPTSIPFPTLKKDDVILEIIPDDHAIVWDLTKQMTAETKLKDLGESERIPRLATDKLWAATEEKTVYGGHHSNRRAGFNANNNNAWNNQGKKNTDTETKSAAGPQKTEVNAKPAAAAKKSTDSTTGSDDDKEAQPTGRVYNKSLGAYESKEGLPITKKIGGVEIDVNKNKVISTYGGSLDTEDDALTENKDLLEAFSDIKENNKDLMQLEVVTVNNINKVVGNSAVVEDIPFEEDEEPAVALRKIAEIIEGGVTTEINLDVDAEAMRKAAELADQLPRFENDDEVFAALDVANPKVITDAPLFALVNRIAKHLFKESVAAGYTLRKQEEKGVAGKTLGKGKKKEQHIITLKESTAALSLALKNSSMTYSKKKEIIDRGLTEMFNKGQGKNLSVSALDTVFSAGDFKKHPEIRQLKLSVMAQKGEEG